MRLHIAKTCFRLIKDHADSLHAVLDELMSVLYETRQFYTQAVAASMSIDVADQYLQGRKQECDKMVAEAEACMVQAQDSAPDYPKPMYWNIRHRTLCIALSKLRHLSETCNSGAELRMQQEAREFFGDLADRMRPSVMQSAYDIGDKTTQYQMHQYFCE